MMSQMVVVLELYMYIKIVNEPESIAPRSYTISRRPLLAPIGSFFNFTACEGARVPCVERRNSYLAPLDRSVHPSTG